MFYIQDERFPKGVGTETSLIHSVLCIPVLLPTGFILGRFKTIQTG